MITYDPTSLTDDKCPHCGCVTSHRGSDIMESWYARDVDNYIRVCTDCHKHFLAPLKFRPGPRQLADEAMLEFIRTHPDSPIAQTHRKNYPDHPIYKTTQP